MTNEQLLYGMSLVALKHSNCGSQFSLIKVKVSVLSYYDSHLSVFGCSDV